MPKPTCYEIYQAAFDRRQYNHPFDRVSAYKIRESRGNLHHELELLRSVQAYLAAPKSARRATQLVGCAPDDMARRLKQVPVNLATELGYNLVPAVTALAVEGVPPSDVKAFALKHQQQVHALVPHCEAARLACRRPSSQLYRELRLGQSLLPGLCLRAIGIADQAVAFCDQQSV